MNWRLKRAIKYIKGYCNKHADCDTCQLLENDDCVLEKRFPCDWNDPGTARQEKEDESNS